MLSSEEFLAFLRDFEDMPTRWELEELIDEEMEKSEEEMDTDLIEYCLKVLNRMDAKEKMVSEERGESNGVNLSCGEENSLAEDEDKTKYSVIRRRQMKKKILITAATIALIICTAIASVIGLDHMRANKIKEIESTIYPVTADFDTAEKQYSTAVPAYDWNDKAKHVGYMNYVFIGKVERLVGTTYTDVRINTLGKVSATPWTNYEVTVLGNIKGNLKTGIKLNIRENIGFDYNSAILQMGTVEALPKEGLIYIFCAFADENGEIYISCHESNIALGENCEEDIQRALSGEKAKTYEENPVIYTINEYQEAEKKYDNSVAGDRVRYTAKAEYLGDEIFGENKEDVVIKRLSMSLDLATIYDSEEERLKDDSLIIVSGEIKETKVILCDLVFTCCTVKIDEVLKGETYYDEILALELGGHLDSEKAKEYISKGDEEYPDGVDVVYMGYETAKVGDKVILYLYECEPVEAIYNEVEGERAYHIAGAVQGKMTLDNGVYVSNTPEKLVKPWSYSLEEIKDKIREAS